MNEFHPELRVAARLIPRFSITSRTIHGLRLFERLRGVSRPPAVDGLSIRDVMVPGPPDNPSLRVRLYRPEPAAGPLPALLWIHGGGFVLGTPEQDEAQCIEMCRDLRLIIAAVDYRLSPEHPYPAALDDAYATLLWLHRQEAELGVSRSRICIGGNSAGAGLAAGFGLLAKDRDEAPVAFQLLIYPMLDDRTALRVVDERRLRLWSSSSNTFGWASYLGRAPGGDDVPDYAAPARRQDLTGLPPTWIGVGTCDLFHDESVDYARRLEAAGGSCELKVVAGAFHGFEVAGARKSVVRDFRRSFTTAISRALTGAPERRPAG